jgi:hypothetical protein
MEPETALNAISHETQEQLGAATVGGSAKPAVDGTVRLSQPATMKAAVRDRYGAPDLLNVREIPRPQTAADEVLVRVCAASVNAADWRIMRGRPLFARPMFGGILRPAAGPLGSDVAGIVEAVGDEVTDLMPGDESLATRTAPSPNTSPDGCSLDVSATVSLRAIRRAMSPDGTLVIVGAGKDVLRRMAAASIRSRLLGQRMVVSSPRSSSQTWQR